MVRTDWMLESMAGSYLLVKGTMPMLLHRDCFRREQLGLYDGVVSFDPGALLGYGSEEEYRKLLQEVGGSKNTVAVQHRYPESELPASACLVSPDLLGKLNRKSSLENWIDRSGLLPRKVLSSSEARREKPSAWPVVLKAAGDMTSGGGAAVRICRDETMWRQALVDFAEAEALVMEDYQVPKQILGVQYAVDADGKVLYLGSSENELKPDGYVHGNWLDAEADAPPEMQAVGRGIVERTVPFGYRGVVGIDFLLAADGRFWAIDFNFRCCSGTPALLLAGSLRREWKCTSLFSSRIFSRLAPKKLFPLLEKGIELREILPVGGYFSEDAPCRPLMLVVAGSSREQVWARRLEWELKLKAGPRRRWQFWR